MVGATGFEPAASWSQTKCSTRLSYAPIDWRLIIVKNGGCAMNICGFLRLGRISTACCRNPYDKNSNDMSQFQFHRVFAFFRRGRTAGLLATACICKNELKICDCAGLTPLQLGGVQLLTLFAEETAGQRVELLAQHRVLAAQLSDGLEQFLFARRHRIALSDAAPRTMFNLFWKMFSGRRLIPRAARARFQVHAVQEQLQGLRGQPDFRAGFAGALRPMKGSLLQALA